MSKVLCSLFAAAVALAPAAALAQYLVPEPPVAVIPAPLAVVPTGPMTEEDAAMIALMHGMVVVEDVDVRMWDGNYEVDGKDLTGEDIVVRIDPHTGEVLDIDH
jgi:hypothetical protein